MTGYGANSFTACGLLFGLYGYLGQANFLQMLGLVVAMMIVLGLIFGMVAAGSDIVAGFQRALARQPRQTYSTVPAWFLTD